MHQQTSHSVRSIRMPALASRRLLAAALLAVSMLAACSDNGIQPEEVTGTYRLHTVNAAPLPFLDYEDESFKSEVLAKSIMLRANGTFIETTTHRSTEDGVVSVGSGSFTGSWTLTDDELTLVYPDGVSESATVSVGMLTGTDGMNVYVYRK